MRASARTSPAPSNVQADATRWRWLLRWPAVFAALACAFAAPALHASTLADAVGAARHQPPTEAPLRLVSIDSATASAVFFVSSALELVRVGEAIGPSGHMLLHVAPGHALVQSHAPRALPGSIHTLKVGGSLPTHAPHTSAGDAALVPMPFNAGTGTDAQQR